MAFGAARAIKDLAKGLSMVVGVLGTYAVGVTAVDRQFGIGVDRNKASASLRVRAQEETATAAAMDRYVKRSPL